MPPDDSRIKETCASCGLNCSKTEIPLCTKLIDAGLADEKTAKEIESRLHFTPKIIKKKVKKRDFSSS